MNETNLMSKMKISKAVATMAIPSVISSLVTVVYNMADTFFVGQTGDPLQVAAVSLTNPIFILFMAFANMFGMGGSATASIAMGEKNEKRMKNVSAFITYASLITGIFFAVILLLGAKPILQIFGADKQTYDLAYGYLFHISYGAPFVIWSAAASFVVRAEGASKEAMIGSMIGTIVNIILDPIMIFGLLGCPKMGVTGAAAATVIGQCVAAIVAFTCNHKFNHDVKLHFRGFRPSAKIIGTIYAIGVPSIIMQSIGSVMTYSMNRILIEFSSTATAVFGVYFKLQSFFFMPLFGLNNGITPIIAYNYGARNRKRMVKTIRLSLITAFCLTFIGFLCFEGIPQILLGMFNASEDMLTIGIPALRIIGIHYLLAWFCIVSGTVFQALGKAVFSMIVSIMRQLVVLIPAAYILSKLGGLHVVWWSFPIAEIVSLVVSLLFLLRINRTVISKIPDGSDIL